MTSQPDEFDDLFQDVRDDLLVEAYALTGDLSVSRTAVRDACAVAWHHWNKVSKLQDRITWLRPHVWRRARVRHSVRPWHKEKNLPHDVAATLGALDKLTLNQRKALVLTHLSPVPIAEAAREIGLTVNATEELVVAAHEKFTLARGAREDEVPALLEALRGAATGRWPRTSIIRRAGTARRRTHTAAALMGTVALVIASGTVLAQGGNDDANLTKQGFDRRPTKIVQPEEVMMLEASTMLEASQLTRVDPKLTWTESGTHDNTTGEGVVLPCQQDRFADPEGQAWVRTFAGASAKSPDLAKASAVQMVELSRTGEVAEGAFAEAAAWFSACTDPGTQMVSYRPVEGVGDEAVLVTLRRWTQGTSTVQVGLARTGQVLTTTVAQTPGWEASTTSSAQLLSAAVNAQCGAPGAATCAGPAQLGASAAPQAGEVPGMVSEFDLPPVAGKPGPWAGSKPVTATKNLAATVCDRTTFSGPQFTNNLTRTFTFPDAKKPDALGLTQSVGSLKSTKAARQMVAKVEDRVSQCADDTFGREVTRLAKKTGEGTSLTAWQIDISVGDDESIPFMMAIIRHGKTVSQVGFVPVRSYRMDRDDFVWLTKRAQERLPRLDLTTGAP